MCELRGEILQHRGVTKIDEPKKWEEWEKGKWSLSKNCPYDKERAVHFHESLHICSYNQPTVTILCLCQIMVRDKNEHVRPVENYIDN